MISREEKNKDVVRAIKRERNLEISKKIFHFMTVIFIIFFLLFAYIYFIGIKGLFVKEYIIQNQNIPKSFHGVKILHFSDLLYGNNIDSDYLDSLLKEINIQKPEIVFFTGNVVNPNYQLTENDQKALNNFFREIPYTIGKYAVMGDKDNNTFDITFDDTDFIILNNETISIYNNSQEKINIIGLSNKLSEVSVNDDYTICLINNFDNFEKYKINANLVFSGYNLGGEIRIINIPLLNRTKYSKFHYQYDNQEIFISSGIGSIHHLRLFNHPSINIYRLYNK